MIFFPLKIVLLSSPKKSHNNRKTGKTIMSTEILLERAPQREPPLVPVRYRPPFGEHTVSCIKPLLVRLFLPKVWSPIF